MFVAVIYLGTMVILQKGKEMEVTILEFLNKCKVVIVSCQNMKTVKNEGQYYHSHEILARPEKLTYQKS